MSDPIQSTLDARQSTHGDFAVSATVIQSLKEACQASPNWHHHRLMDVQKQAIEMICLKLGRILTGNPDHPDHWLDIQGYARLAEPKVPKA